MSNSNPDSQALQDIVKLLSQQLGELKHTNQNGSNNRTGGSTDYARSYRQRSNVSGPNFGSGASFSNQLVGDTKNGFNKMTLGLLPVLENNFLKPFQKIWGSTNTSQSFIGKLSSSFTAIFTGLLGVINDVVGTIYSIFKGVLTQAFNKFMDMQRIVGNLAADIGLSKAESKNLLLNFTQLTTTAIEFGGEMGDIKDIMAGFSETTGKNKIFNNEDVKNIEQLGRGTALGVDGMTKMVAEFGNLGISMKSVFDLTEKARVSAIKLGINSKKVLDSYSQLVTGLTGFQMKSGLDNMVKLATQATQLRMDLTGVAESMSDKFFDPEGAVEAAAKMNVLGGQFGEKFGDAFQLMFKAQTAPEELAKDIMDVTKGMGRIDENGMFYMDPATRQILKEATKTLPVDFKQMMNGAAEQAKLTDKISKLSNKGIILGNEGEQAIANLMEFDKSKKEYLVTFPDGTKKELSKVSQDMIDGIIKQKQADDNAAKSRMSFTDKLASFWNRIQSSFSQVFAKIFDSLTDSGFMGKLDDFVKSFTNKIIPLINKVFDKDLTGIIKNIFEGLTVVMGKITKILNGKDTFWNKIKDMAVTAIKGIWDVVSPYLEVGLAKLLIIIGNALPKILGGGENGSIARAGKNMLLDVAVNNKDNKTLQKLTGSQSEKQKYISEYKEHLTELSLLQKAGVVIAGAIGALAGPGGSIVAGTATAAVEKMWNNSQAEKDQNKYDTIPSDDALMTPGGRVFKGGKGDIGVLFDQAGLSNNSGGGSGKTEISHSGTITVKSEDGKQITINDLEKIGRHTLASYLDSLNYGLKNGNSLQNNERMPITPISR